VRYHQRRSIRLPRYDYRDGGAYFVTICTAARDCILAEPCIADAILKTWRAVGKYARAASGDEFVVMPNHVHGIIWLDPPDRSPPEQPPSRLRMSSTTGHPIVEPGSLGAIVRAFKSATTKRVNASRGTPGLKIWQRGYHETIIRSENHLRHVRQYIRDNPRKWDEDPNNPKNVRPSPPT
jgi:REP element-mobilizing transposase RayT